MPAKRFRLFKFIQSLCFLFIAAAASRRLVASAPPIRYDLDLRDPASHLVRVTMIVPEAGPRTEIQFPAWNNLYEIRDFIKDVQDLRGQCEGRAVALTRVDLDTWRGPEMPCSALWIQYAVYADEESVFSSILNAQHAFLNFAQLLFYLPKERSRPVQVSLVVPAGWKVATAFEHSAQAGVYSAPNYDVLADCPVEAGHFQEYQYQQNGATYRIVVDAVPQDFLLPQLLDMVKKVTAIETALMEDVPFRRYTLIYHFLPSGGGGMEHRYGCAIGIPSATVRQDMARLESITAHEFFHLWNVKRIRPQGLEPVDYVRGNDTRDLWFSEGITSMYAALVLVRAGFESYRDFYRHIAAQIAELQRRSARLYQSVEDSGREAWLEKYPDYFRPERSISYYNKGELLGFLLDLAIRQGSDDRYSMDDLMRALDRDFAQRGRFFTDDDLRAEIEKLAPEFTGLDEFFSKYVFGTSELDYNRFLGYAGLDLATKTVQRPSLGFVPVRGFEGPVVVESVVPGGPAEQAGLQAGDVLLEFNGAPVSYPPSVELLRLKTGSTVTLLVQRGRQRLQVAYRLSSERTEEFSIKELKHATAAQLRIRKSWLSGTTDGAP